MNLQPFLLRHDKYKQATHTNIHSCIKMGKNLEHTTFKLWRLQCRRIQMSFIARSTTDCSVLQLRKRLEELTQNDVTNES